MGILSSHPQDLRGPKTFVVQLVANLDTLAVNQVVSMRDNHAKVPLQ